MFVTTIKDILHKDKRLICLISGIMTDYSAISFYISPPFTFPLIFEVFWQEREFLKERGSQIFDWAAC
jgi:hypothetical protein